MLQAIRAGDLPTRLAVALTERLPGQVAQDRMKPVKTDGTVIERPPLRDDTRDAAVLLLLYPHAVSGHWHLSLIKRPDYDGVHSGQIALPGGRREADETLVETALREAQEEIGIDSQRVEILGRLTAFYVFASNHLVYPYIGVSADHPQFTPCAVEVAQIIEAPLQRLLDPATLRRETRELRWGPAHIPYFDVDGHKVWGATAMMLSEFIELIHRL